MHGLTKGMTLIELVVAVAIVGILAGVAYPSYQQQIRKSRRAAAAAFVLDVAIRQQQRWLDVRSYASSLAASGMTAPADVSDFYDVAITMAAITPPQFSISAVPKAAQAADACGTLSVDHNGTKTAMKDTVIVEKCW